ncbi:hypothetical protein KP509_36G061800 [Ceratopteris richardii]|uniref:Uncharacterized protein n=1 Tax=Ceratopteris richardii TaxID=49495 RepID=A0A8T2QCH6_CERRI|nr:hypothetical protein KP509_36G061800 [Ceratopteris richardii]KAH7281748.1 hypothetical protein KP509_36G061800 [Ceratopteris richardii]KAH7281749.1 hypothetical protein KP509_36G061800 [Ceratopteris richardii]KAH7281751.1 hypothetical protein KP509_36G061800 [Ceratopteris richardii]KAH7281752.1 hypothetical protein KP509_36G061800 [Ceratopteris richardii]
MLKGHTFSRSPKANPEIHRTSNLVSILKYTTPSVECQYQPKNTIADRVQEQAVCACEYVPFFKLGDLWQSFDEWSVYGAEVPLQLPSGETTLQYYVPYLSALQIYLQPESNACFSKRRFGDDSDWSDTTDVRDASSDLGSDNESEKLQYRMQIGCENWESSSCVSSGSSEQGDRHGEPAFEYFERGSPYCRAPLSGKVNDLASRFPPLRWLHSNELSPLSWLSVAWYPIYRIPMGATMSDLSTCFLTFHSLWTPPCLQDMIVNAEARVQSYLFSDSRNGPEKECLSSCMFKSCSSKIEHAQWLKEHIAWRIKDGMLELPPFGLASYKLQGPFWAAAAPIDEQHALSLLKSADFWIKQLRVQHPDYKFFTSREPMNFHK